MVARYRSRRMGLRPVQSLKHIVDSRSTLVEDVTLPIDIVIADESPTISSTNQVMVMSTVHGVYLRVEAASTQFTQGAIPSFYMVVFKNPGGNLTNPDPTTTGGLDTKKFIIHQEMVMLNNVSGGNARTVFNGVIRIPPRLKRFGINDKLTVIVRSFGIDSVVCIQAIYKEFR